MLPRPLAIVLAISLAACSSVAVSPVRERPSTASTDGGVQPSLPHPDEAMPAGAPALADRLARTTTALEAEVEAWRSTGDPARWPPPEAVVLLALDQQRIYQALAGDPALRRRTLARLPSELRAGARDLAIAGARLASGAGPVTRTPRLDTTDPPPADELRTFYDEAEARFGVGWELLAAVHLIETRFGRVVSHSSAGARGPMQFLPATWRAYGLGGDVRDPRDAILGAANYLSASGAPGRERQALLAYNPVGYYADAVAGYARAIRRDPATYYALYNWQVFVRTPSGGLLRLTGPGR